MPKHNFHIQYAPACVILSQTKPTFPKYWQILFTHQIFESSLDPCLHFSNKPAASWSSEKGEGFTDLHMKSGDYLEFFPKQGVNTRTDLCKQEKQSFTVHGK